MSNQSPFTVTQELVNIATAYKNTRFIADEVFPRVPVSKAEFKYMTFPQGESLKLPSTVVGRKGKVNKVSFTGVDATGSCQDYGLEDDIPYDDIANAPANYDPLGHSTEYLTHLILTDREVRAAALAFTSGNYGSSNKTNVGGGTRWTTTAGTPIAQIQAAIDSCVIRPNFGAIGRAAFSILAQNADIVAAVNRNSGTKGIATRRAIADLFELDDLFVGESYYDTTKKGQTATLARAWGKSMLVFYREPLANTKQGITFGFTAQFGERIAATRDNPDVGLKGGITVRVGESVDEVITATDLCGHLLYDVCL
jgi:hypothetical protein